MLLPPTSRISPVAQPYNLVFEIANVSVNMYLVLLPAIHITPASLVWSQFSISRPLWAQLNNLLSKPLHLTSSNNVGSLPCPNIELITGIAPIES